MLKNKSKKIFSKTIKNPENGKTMKNKEGA